MKFGLCCICKELGDAGSFKKITKSKYLKMLNTDRASLVKELKNKALTNLYNSYRILQWCVKNKIGMYRFSSELIPLATIQTIWDWQNDADVIKICSTISRFTKDNNIRTSFHPDQFVILTNWENDEIFNNSLKELEYHNSLCSMLGCDTILIHVGGVYNNKPKAKETFVTNFLRLPEQIRNRLHLENDDKSYNAQDVLELCQTIDIPMVLDLHHDRCNPSDNSITDYIHDIIDTWAGRFPKCHISSGSTGRTDRHHADTISVDDWHEYMSILGGRMDIMVEAKAKEEAIQKLLEVA